MGTDIHAVFQKRLPCGRWEDVDSEYAENRHYQLFAVLAGVRNGTGFTGIVTGDPVTPISEPRGFPEDFEVDDASHFGKWMGDHRHSWLLGSEVLAWAENAPTVVQRGIVDRRTYEAWDKVSPPDSYGGAIWGRGAVIVKPHEVEATPDYTHVCAEWKSDLSDELSYFIDEVRRLVDGHGDVRMVFGFDS